MSNKGKNDELLGLTSLNYRRLLKGCTALCETFQIFSVPLDGLTCSCGKIWRTHCLSESASYFSSHWLQTCDGAVRILAPFSPRPHPLRPLLIVCSIKIQGYFWNRIFCLFWLVVQEMETETCRIKKWSFCEVKPGKFKREIKFLQLKASQKCLISYEERIIKLIQLNTSMDVTSHYLHFPCCRNHPEAFEFSSQIQFHHLDHI